MTYFVNPDARHRISMRAFDGSDEWFEIPARLSRADRLALMDGVIDVEITGEGEGKINPKVYLLRQFQTTLNLTVKAWSFRDEEQNPVPVSPETVQCLGEEAGEYMAREIDAYYKRQKQEREVRENDRDFTKPVLRSIEGRASPPPGPSPSSSLNGSATEIPTGSAS